MKQEVIMRTVLFSMLLSAGLALPSAANAAPMSGAFSAAGQETAPLLVRDGCGAGRHFSKYRGICVWDRARYYGPAPYAPPPPAYGYGYYGPRYYGPPVYGPGFYGPGYGYYGYYRRW
jgi:hypothetical protein